jgi:hypothetical protein
VGDAQGKLERKIEERVDEEPRKPDQEEQHELHDRRVPEPIQAEQVTDIQELFSKVHLAFAVLAPAEEDRNLDHVAGARLDEDLERDLVAQRR